MNTDLKKQHFRDIFKSYAKQTLKTELGVMSSKQVSYHLMELYVNKIYNSLYGYISDEDFSNGYVDASSDLGIDFIYRSDNKVEIFQVKYAKENSTAKAEDIEHFQRVFLRITDDDFKPNDKLKELIADIDFENDVFQLRYITLAKIVGQAKIQTSALISCPPHLTDLADRVSIDFYDEQTLNEEIRNALTLQGGISKEKWTLVSFGKRDKRSEIIEISTGGHRSVVIVLSAEQIVNLYKRFKDALFTLNIRNYIGSTQTNKNLIETAWENPQDFFLFNNGISCLATKVDIQEDGDRVEVEGIQVINGAQTVRSLVKASQSEHIHKSTSDAIVLVRITEIPSYASSSSFVQNIVRYNNTQNVIKVSDFRSNDPIQNDVKARFSKMYRNGKAVEYIPKRTDRPKPNSIPIKMEDFAKAIYSFLHDPVGFANSASILFDDREDGGYKFIFGDGKHIWTEMPEEEFRLRSAIWWMSTEFGIRLTSERQNADATDKMALERKWFLLYSSRLILEESFGSEAYPRQLVKYYRGDWKLGENTTGEWFQTLYNNAKFAVTYIYKQAKKRPGFVHRNWNRSRNTPLEIAEFLEGNPSLRMPALK